MDLWIRSQDRTILTKVDNICIMENRIVFIPNKMNGRATLGTFKTDKRALEVLNEIQDKIKTLLYLKPKSHLNLEDIKAVKRYFEDLNKTDFIVCDNNFEIEPITTDVIVYEMPQD